MTFKDTLSLVAFFVGVQSVFEFVEIIASYSRFSLYATLKKNKIFQQPEVISPSYVKPTKQNTLYTTVLLLSSKLCDTEANRNINSCCSISKHIFCFRLRFCFFFFFVKNLYMQKFCKLRHFSISSNSISI